MSTNLGTPLCCWSGKLYQIHAGKFPVMKELACRLSLGIDGQNAPGNALPLGIIPGRIPFQGRLGRFGPSPCSSVFLHLFMSSSELIWDQNGKVLS